LAAEPLESPVYSEKAMFDFIFIGGKFHKNGFLERKRLMEDLEVNHNLKIVNGNTLGERAKVYKAMPKLYGSSKFSLDISHFWDIESYTSNRYWVIPAFFGFPVTRRFPGCEDLVPEDIHVYWDTVEELMEKMDYYRGHEKERKEMIEKGHQYAKDHHTYEHRINRIIELL